MNCKICNNQIQKIYENMYGCETLENENFCGSYSICYGEDLEIIHYGNLVFHFDPLCKRIILFKSHHWNNELFSQQIDELTPELAKMYYQKLIDWTTFI